MSEDKPQLELDDEPTRSAEPDSDDEAPGPWDERTRDYGMGFGDEPTNALPPTDLIDEPTPPEPDRVAPTESDDAASLVPDELAPIAPPSVDALATALDVPRPAPSESLGDEFSETIDEPRSMIDQDSTRIDADLMQRFREHLSAKHESSAADAAVGHDPAHAPPGTSHDPFNHPDLPMTTIPDVIPSDHSSVSAMTDADSVRIARTDEIPIPPPPSFPNLSGAETQDVGDTLGEPLESASHEDLLTLDPSEVAANADERADLDDASVPSLAPGELVAEKSGPRGTLVLDDQVSDPATLPPAFPSATTGDLLFEEETKAPPSDEPPPPPSADLEAEDSAGDDAWAGYDDSGGWHTLTGESQVSIVDEPIEEAPAAASANANVFDSSSAAPRNERAHLVGIQGADTGRRHALYGDEVLVGRSSRCTIVLAEPSVSRQHARIERRDNDGFWVVDLDSGNGTYVNGQRLNQSRLYSGDEVTFGNGTFQFVEVGQQFEPVDASAAPVRAEASRSLAATASWLGRPLPLFLASGIMLGLVVILLVVFQISASRDAEAHNAAFNRWLFGLENFSSQRWNQAEKSFREALELVPGHKRSLRYLDALRYEREAQKILAEAETSLRREDLKDAYVLAIRITNSIAYGDEARAVLASIDRIVDQRLGEARASLNSGRRARFDKILAGLEFVEPYRPEIPALRAQADRSDVESGDDARKRIRKRRRRR